MLPLAHAGIALGAVLLVERLAGRKRVWPERANPGSPPETLFGKLRGLTGSFLHKLDLRFLLLGAVLPDIIDKPVGQFFFSETFSNGRIYGHSLLLFMVIFVAGLVIFGISRKTWMLALGLGVLSHLLLDRMWMTPETLLWPALGSFPREDLTEWTARILRELFVNPAVYFFEYVGALVLGWFGLRLLEEKRLGVFLRHGVYF